MTEQAKECEKCKNWPGVGAMPLNRGEYLTCLKGHRPRFYQPRSPVDWEWGYRRVCEDFQERSEKR